MLMSLFWLPETVPADKRLQASRNQSISQLLYAHAHQRQIRAVLLCA